MRIMLSEKLYVLAELAQDLNLRIWSLWGGDYCVAFAHKDYVSVYCRVRPTLHSQSALCFKAPLGIEGAELVEALTDGDFEAHGWEYCSKKPKLPFDPKNLFEYPYWMDPPVPVRVPNKLYGFLMGKDGTEWNIFVDARGVKHIVIRDKDAEVIVLYPSAMWRA